MLKFVQEIGSPLKDFLSEAKINLENIQYKDTDIKLLEKGGLILANAGKSSETVMNFGVDIYYGPNVSIKEEITSNP